MSQDLQTLNTVYQFIEIDASGNPINLSQYAGKLLLIVNIATKETTAPIILKQLYVLSSFYKSRGLVLLLFPCNQFGEHETMEEIQTYLKTNDINIGPLFHLVDVNGPQTTDLYKFLKSKKIGNVSGFITGSYTMFIIDRNGKPVQRLRGTSSLQDIRDKIEIYIGKN